MNGVYICESWVLPCGFQFAIWDLLQSAPVGLYSNSRFEIDRELALCNAGGGVRFGVIDLWDLSDSLIESE